MDSLILRSSTTAFNYNNSPLLICQLQASFLLVSCSSFPSSLFYGAPRIRRECGTYALPPDPPSPLDGFEVLLYDSVQPAFHGTLLLRSPVWAASTIDDMDHQ